ncbi:hypothetical protein ABZ348_18365 [Streptomyces sp. NPDC005963]|uniref:hypothetical protein n=1 Tax=Streptomyces sp. NPDC005963 TaxID=3156721 RepID=UPI0033D596DD
MITARSPIGVLRPATFRGPLHFLWLTLLVLGLLSAHGTNAEGITHHPTSTAFLTVNAGQPVTDAPTVKGESGSTSHQRAVDGALGASTDGARASGEVHTGGSVHHIEQCMPTQPQLTPSSHLPCPAALTQSSRSDWTPPAPSLDGSSGTMTVADDARAHDVLRI